MFCVLFEVHPRRDQWEAYLGHARMLQPELERVEGFIDNIRYKSLTREGWLLSLSSWRDEKAVIRWRTTMRHHEVQQQARSGIFLDYHLRVGEVTHDTRLPGGHRLQEQRLDETEVGEGTTVTLIDGTQTAEWIKAGSADDVALWLGLDRKIPGLVSWDVFDAVLTPGGIIMLATWRDRADATLFERNLSLAEGKRLRQIRIVRDYGMFDRREAPQYFSDAPGAQTLRS
jgi:heme-degrading monooxygenase HmoA